MINFMIYFYDKLQNYTEQMSHIKKYGKLIVKFFTMKSTTTIPLSFTVYFVNLLLLLLNTRLYYLLNYHYFISMLNVICCTRSENEEGKQNLQFA